MKQFPVILLPKEKLVDTNGAGIRSLPTLDSVNAKMKYHTRHIPQIGYRNDLT